MFQNQKQKKHTLSAGASHNRSHLRPENSTGGEEAIHLLIVVVKQMPSARIIDNSTPVVHKSKIRSTLIWKALAPPTPHPNPYAESNGDRHDRVPLLQGHSVRGQAISMQSNL